MLDRHSEIIAHFIGQFDQVAEQSLFRLQYDAFRTPQVPDEEPAPLLEINVNVTSTLSADTHVADRISWYAEDLAPRREQMDLEAHARDISPVQPAPIELTLVNFHFEGGSSGFAVQFTPVMPQPPSLPEAPQIPQMPVFDLADPGGIGVLAYQQNILQDSDLVLMRPLNLSPELAASRSDAALDDGLMTLAATADTLTPGDFTLGRDTEDATSRIETLRETYAQTDPAAAPEGAGVTLVSAAEGTLPDSGILVDGAEAESLPEALDAALDAHGYGDDHKDEDTDTGPDEAAPPQDNAEPTDAGAPTEETAVTGAVSATLVIVPEETGPIPGTVQTIETGGNLLMNNEVSSLSPIDAPLIAVGGQAVSLTVISQVNVMSDRDTLLGPEDAFAASAAPADTAEAPGSKGHNIASVKWQGESRGNSDNAGSGNAKGVGNGNGHAKGHPTEPDEDTGPLAFAITEIGGDLVLTTHVVQLNLTTDNDVVSFQTTFHEVAMSTGDNLSVNVMGELGFQNGFDMILVGGDMVNLVSVSQLNLLFDNDLVVDTDGVGGDVQTTGNLLWNQAEVTWHGIDTVTAEMSESTATALDTMAGGQIDLAALKGESLLDGNQVPLLLTVGGNLVLDYRLEQINILADADTVQLFADAAAAAGFTPVNVATGDNLLANVANLEVHGTDSTVMAAGGAFSDLVIYQAGMYDTDDTPLGPGHAGPDLASEAVVFLADGMIDEGHGDVPPGGEVIVDTGGGSGTFDTLGGVVA